ncbi:HAD-IC family P-type ATPase [Schaalia sp. lx-100]|uniref:HAD-IC family P-type ATPase n=1 Tax=Schaalia sp. lx-100 TaxID=2899081 RepID=UPI0022AC1221|nr:HAD-IC family P-type ATPase [Schaalia sp. lx-100]
MPSPSSPQTHSLHTRLWVTIPLTLIIVTLSMIPAFQFDYYEWTVAFLSLPIVTWAAWPFHRAAWRAGRHGSTTMDTLVSLGVIVTTVWSWTVLLLGTSHAHSMHMGWASFLSAPSDSHYIYIEAAATIVCFLLIGRTLESRAKHEAGDALRALLDMGAHSATRITIDPDNGQRSEESIPIAQLRVADTFLTRPGEKIAADGIVIDGFSAIDASMLTGESLPVDVHPGSSVTGATINTWGTLLVRATRVGNDTDVARMGKILAQAQTEKAPAQRLADRVSSIFVPVVLLIAALTFCGHLLVGHSLSFSLVTAVSVIVVACPCALGLATPMALLVGSGRASHMGILIRHPEVLERTQHADTVILDKTGTLTTAHMTVENIYLNTAKTTSEGNNLPEGKLLSEDNILALAAGLESFSEHPIARAIVAAAKEKNITPTPLTAFSNHPGFGVCAIHIAADNTHTRAFLGQPSWFTERGLQIPEELAAHAQRAQESGASAVFLAHIDGQANPALRQEASPTHDENTTTSRATHTTVDMSIHGMTCASCVRRVERKLGKLDGVHALVNLATESATLTLTRPYSDAELEKVVENAGYQGKVQARHTNENIDTSAGHTISDLTQTPSLFFPEDLSNGSIQALFIIRDTIKAHAYDTIVELKNLGLRPLLVTGDNEGAAHYVANQVGISDVYAHALPEDKRRIVQQLEQDGHVVVMVGDGVNDAAALAQAHHCGLGIAMGSGTDVANNAADITLVTSDVRRIPTALRIARDTLRIIRANLFWAFAYNVAMIPLAVAGMLNPMIASAAMAFSSVFVVLNSLRLKKSPRQ